MSKSVATETASWLHLPRKAQTLEFDSKLAQERFVSGEGSIFPWGQDRDLKGTARRCRVPPGPSQGEPRHRSLAFLFHLSLFFLSIIYFGDRCSVAQASLHLPYRVAEVTYHCLCVSLWTSPSHKIRIPCPAQITAPGNMKSCKMRKISLKVDRALFHRVACYRVLSLSLSPLLPSFFLILSPIPLTPSFSLSLFPPCLPFFSLPSSHPLLSFFSPFPSSF